MNRSGNVYRHPRLDAEAMAAIVRCNVHHAPQRRGTMSAWKAVRLGLLIALAIVALEWWRLS